MRFGIHMAVSFQDGKGVVPVFPLPNVILYPKALLPLHIFEPRYLELIKDCIKGDRQMAMALLQPGWENDYFGRPPIHRIAGLGEMVQWDELPNGKFNVLLRGISRVDINEEFGGGPYRIAQVSLITETSPPPDRLAEEKMKLIKGLRQLNEDRVHLPEDVSVGHLADMVTVALPIETKRKQELFEMLETDKRVNAVLEEMEVALSRREQFRTAEHFFPNDVSLN